MDQVTCLVTCSHSLPRPQYLGAKALEKNGNGIQRYSLLNTILAIFTFVMSRNVTLCTREIYTVMARVAMLTHSKTLHN